MDLSEETITKLCAYVRTGINPDVAASAEGIPLQTLYSWLDRGRAEPGTIYSEFVDRLIQAKAQGEVLHVQRIVALGGARESQWILERMYPEKWGLKRPEGKKTESLKAIDAAFSSVKKLTHESKQKNSRSK